MDRQYICLTTSQIWIPAISIFPMASYVSLKYRGNRNTLEDDLHLHIHTSNRELPHRLDSLCRHCDEYEAAIEEAGGIDLQLLGLGRMGHIGFNERGYRRIVNVVPCQTQVSHVRCLLASKPDSPFCRTSRESRTHMVYLDRVTRLDAASDFFGEQHVPCRAITMGISTILKVRIPSP